MTERPIFIPTGIASPLVKVKLIDFKWHPGFAISQKQKSIASLHQSAILRGLATSPLEISSKSPSDIGRALSAFNLHFNSDGWPKCQVEQAFQSSKVFEFGGPFADLTETDPQSAKKDTRLQKSGNLIAFEFNGDRWDIKPRTIFYDWLYINALKQNPDLMKMLPDHDAFTDIEFNPDKSINCQAYSAALFVSLVKIGYDINFICLPENFKRIIKASVEGANNKPVQGKLF